jgi:hypothetical protein
VTAGAVGYARLTGERASLDRLGDFGAANLGHRCSLARRFGPGYSTARGLGASLADHFSSIRPNRQIANATSHAATNRATMP